MVVMPPSVAIVTFYAGLNAVIAFVLAALVIRQRQKTRTVFGTGGHLPLEQAIRAHGNFVEYVPLILLLMLLLELGGLGALWLHLMGVALTLGRLLHAWGLSTTHRGSFGRSAGIALTWLAMLAAIVLCIVRGAVALAGAQGGIIG
ncbi:MAG TPA: MAPEG family protein [Stellaceae bacterium]